MKITLFSNGTAFINRDYNLSGGQRSKISIPVKKDYLDEVISSIDVLGKVAIPSPPSFRPTNSEKLTLVLDSSNIIRDLAIKLAGTQVEVTGGSNKITGTLMGIQEVTRISANGQTVDDFKVSVLDDKGQVHAVDFVTSIRPMDATVQAELGKAMRACAEKIKPDSTFIDLEISNPAEFASQATVCYSIPSAAWKTSYRLRKQANEWKLESMAIVDNDTEEDWKDCTVSVVTGQPITFSTDLAEAKIPARNRVNVVSDKSLGAVEHFAAMYGSPAPAAKSLCGGNFALAEGAAVNRNSRTQLASRQQADHREVGDYAVFTTKNPVTIEANRSAIVPMFETDLDAKSMLYYNIEDHSERPYRAVRFKNASPYSLNRGVVSCVDEDTLLGKAVLNGTKQGEDATVVYALETGVRVSTNIGKRNSSMNRIQIKKGAVISQRLESQKTTYTVRNSKNESFAFEIEHKRALHDSKITADDLELVETSNGARACLTLAANEVKKIVVFEESALQESFEFEDENFVSWLSSHEMLHDLAAVKEAIEIQEDIENIEAKIAQSEKEAQALTEMQDRLKGLIPVSADAQANEWRSELSKNEKSWRDIKFTVLPKMTQAMQEKRKQLRAKLKELTVTWNQE